jgi:hypothetical protein
VNHRQSRLFVLALVAGVPAAFAQVQERIPGPSHERFMPHEQFSGEYILTDPNIPQPRTPAFFTPRGFPVSIQANVDANGMNIVGDAANEPSIASDPRFPNRIVIGWRQFDTILNSFREAGYAWSDDFGRTWHKNEFTPGTFRSDPVLRASADGTIYYNSLRIDPFEVDYFRSTDGGQTWSAPVFAFGGDKTWFAIDKSNTSRRGSIIQAWNCCAFNRSLNAGLTWSAPSGSLGIVFGTIDIGVNGEVYVIGQSGGVSILRSLNALDPVVPVPAFQSLFTGVFPSAGSTGQAPNPGGLIGQHQILVERNHPQRLGWLYALSTVNRSANATDVAFRRSTNGGTTWDPIVFFNGGVASINSFQWFGTMGLAPNGRIDIVYNDTSQSLAANLSRTMYTFSTDAGTTWSAPEQLGPQWNSHVGWPQQNKIGDYYDVESDNLGFNLAYATTYNGEHDVYYMRYGPRPCDDVDFNNDGSVFDPDDIDAFLSVFSEGPCIPAGTPGGCNDIDFNNDGSTFDPTDIDAFLLAFSEGPCEG